MSKEKIDYKSILEIINKRFDEIDKRLEKVEKQLQNIEGEVEYAEEMISITHNFFW